MRNTINLDDISVEYLFDDLPFWSAPFGFALLNTVNLRKNIKVLDIGSGFGFPAIELAQRLGTYSKIYCVDPWEKAIEVIKRKVKFYGLDNLETIQGKAENITFEDNTFDLITSNNGLNNVQDLKISLSEVFRVAKPNAQMVFTVNLPETFIEFYNVFEEVLRDGNKISEIYKLKEHIHSKRKNFEEYREIVVKSGFFVENITFDSFKYRFIDGTSFFNYYFTRLAFLESWYSIVDSEERQVIFDKLEISLNELAYNNSGLTLTVPFACFNCYKRS